MRSSIAAPYTLCAHLRLQDVSDPDARARLRVEAKLRLEQMVLHLCPNRRHEAHVSVYEDPSKRLSNGRSDRRFLAFVDFVREADMRKALQEHRFMSVGPSSSHLEMTLYVRSKSALTFSAGDDQKLVVLDLVHKSTSSASLFAALQCQTNFGPGAVRRMLRVSGPRLDTVCVELCSAAAHEKARTLLQSEPILDVAGSEHGYAVAIRVAAADEMWWA